MRVAATREPAVKQNLPETGKMKNATNENAKRMLGWAPRSNEESIVATAARAIEGQHEKAAPALFSWNERAREIVEARVIP